MNEELKPCPFCGGSAAFIGKEVTGYRAACVACDSHGGWGDYGYQAEKAWNTRASDAHIERIEALNARYQLALEQIGRLSAYPQEFYDRNGPQWTGKDGHEYCDQDIVISLGNDINEIVSAALSNATLVMKGEG